MVRNAGVKVPGVQYCIEDCGRRGGRGGRYLGKTVRPKAGTVVRTMEGGWGGGGVGR